MSNNDAYAFGRSRCEIGVSAIEKMKPSHQFYGNIMTFIIYIPVAPFHSWEASKLSRDDPDYFNAWIVAWGFNISAFIATIALVQQSATVIKYLPTMSNAVSLALLNLMRWPSKNECGIVQQLLFIIMCIQANLPMGGLAKLVQTMWVFTVGCFVLYVSPLVDFFERVPLFALATAVSVAIIFAAGDWISAVMTVNVARLGLVCVFIQHVSTELMLIVGEPNYQQVGSTNILKAAFLAVVGIVAAGVFSNVTDAKNTLEVLVAERTKEIQSQSERLRMVELAVQASDTAIAIVRQDCSIVWMNAALDRLTFKRSGDLIRRLDLQQQDVRRLERAFQGRDETLTGIQVGNSIHNIEVSTFPYDEMTTIPGGSRFVVVFRDVTAERAREKAELAAEKKALHVQAMTESIEVVSHELRTPMQCTMGIASLLLQDKSVPEDMHESISLIMASSVLLLTLVNNMLDVRKCEANMMTTFKVDSIDPSPVVQEAVNFCQPLAKISKLTIDTRLEPTRLVRTDPLRFQQILINLISNAIKHTPSGGRVTIQSTLSSRSEVERLIGEALVLGRNTDEWKGVPYENVLVISVVDSGIGIPESQRRKLFRKFSQLDDKMKNKLGENIAGQPSGTGIGLNLCLTFVHLMNGEIWATNNKSSSGCTFSFYLPISKDEPRRIMSSGSLMGKLNEIETSGNRFRSPEAKSLYRVMVVDDTMLNRKVIERMLKQVGVQEVKTFESGQKALDVLEGEEYDLILTDIQMPGMSGFEFSELLHSSQRIMNKPIVVGLTADTSADLRERCTACGMSDVLQKPITLREMKDYFDNVLDSLLHPVII